MNVEKISAVMDKFEKQFEDLDLATGVMEQSMQQSSSLTMPEQQVEGLMQQVADEHGLEFSAGLPGVGAGVGEKVVGARSREEGGRAARAQAGRCVHRRGGVQPRRRLGQGTMTSRRVAVEILAAFGGGADFGGGGGGGGEF